MLSLIPTDSTDLLGPCVSYPDVPLKLWSWTSSSIGTTGEHDGEAASWPHTYSLKAVKCLEAVQESASVMVWMSVSQRTTCQRLGPQGGIIG
jgi:hypothetical protein